jgi:hypothetical protein
MMPTAVKFVAVEAEARSAADPGRLLRALARLLDSLAPYRRPADYSPPPPEWYQYPPC